MKITLRQLAERMLTAAEVASGVERVQADIERAAVEDVRRRMDAGLQPDGTPQPPLKRARRSGNDGPPLVDFRNLYKSVRAEVKGSTLLLVATGPGARRHQETRPFLGLSEEGKAEVVRLIMVGIMRAFTEGN